MLFFLNVISSSTIDASERAEEAIARQQ